MADTADALYQTGLDLFSEVVHRVAPDGWSAPSPCEGWTALDVLGHLGTAVGMGTSLLQGEQPSWPEFERPGDLVGDDPRVWWDELAAESHRAVAGADLELVMDTPMGPRTVADRLAFPAIDLYVHAWDVGRATGIEVEIPDDLIAFAHRYLDPFPPEKVRGPGGAFGPEVDPPGDASPTEVFVAWTGRRPRGPA